jgi:hypothetical protein
MTGDTPKSQRTKFFSVYSHKRKLYPLRQEIMEKMKKTLLLGIKLHRMEVLTYTLVLVILMITRTKNQ